MVNTRQTPENTTSQIMRKFVRSPKSPENTITVDDFAGIGTSKRKRTAAGDNGGNDASIDPINKQKKGKQASGVQANKRDAKKTKQRKSVSLDSDGDNDFDFQVVPKAKRMKADKGCDLEFSVGDASALQIKGSPNDVKKEH